jgi:ankyrin repeat protein
MWAARNGHTEVVNSLLDAGADANLRDCASNGWTALIHAIHKNQNQAARVLIGRGADVNARAGHCEETLIEDGPTPLLFAAGSDNTEIVKALLEKGADPYAGPVLSNAVAGGWDVDRPTADRCPTETVKALFEKAPDLSLGCDPWERSAMWFARRRHCSEVVELVKQHNAHLVGAVVTGGKYKIKVVPDGWLGTSMGLEERDQMAKFEYSSLFGSDVEVLIKDGKLTVDGKRYGALKEGDTIIIDHGRVLVNSREVREGGVIASN